MLRYVNELMKLEKAEVTSEHGESHTNEMHQQARDLLCMYREVQLGAKVKQDISE